VKEVERETEKIARRMAKEAGQPESLWELFLLDAYQEYYGLNRKGQHDD
jgi:hypothetical protein